MKRRKLAVSAFGRRLGFAISSPLCLVFGDNAVAAERLGEAHGHWRRYSSLRNAAVVHSGQKGMM